MSNSPYNLDQRAPRNVFIIFEISAGSLGSSKVAMTFTEVMACTNRQLVYDHLKHQGHAYIIKANKPQPIKSYRKLVLDLSKYGMIHVRTIAPGHPTYQDYIIIKTPILTRL